MTTAQSLSHTVLALHGAHGGEGIRFCSDNLAFVLRAYTDKSNPCASSQRPYFFSE